MIIASWGGGGDGLLDLMKSSVELRLCLNDVLGVKGYILMMSWGSLPPF